MSNSKLLETIQQVVSSRADSGFTPTNAQKRVKSAFWTHFGTGSSIQAPTEPTLAIAASFDPQLRQYWTQPGFKEWFWNQSEFDERLDFLAQVALDELESILSNRQVAPSAKLPAIKIALELSGKLGSKSAESGEFADAKIASMDRKQLEEYIQKSLRLVSGPDNRLTESAQPDTITPAK